MEARRTIPAEFFEAAQNPTWIVSAFNDQFERLIEQHILAPRYDWPLVPLAQHRCLQATALAHPLPASLAGAAAALGLDQQKDTIAYAWCKYRVEAFLDEFEKAPIDEPVAKLQPEVIKAWNKIRNAGLKQAADEQVHAAAGPPALYVRITETDGTVEQNAAVETTVAYLRILRIRTVAPNASEPEELLHEHSAGGLTLWRAPFLQHIEERSAAKETFRALPLSSHHLQDTVRPNGPI